VDKWVSTLTGRIQQLETNPPKPDDNKDEEDDDDGFQELEEDVVYGSNGLPDHIKTSANRLRRRRLLKNKIGTGVIRTGTIKVTMILMLKLNLPFHLSMENMMLRNT